MRLGRTTGGVPPGRGREVERLLLREHGFSLVELMVVIAIIAILASIGIPALRGLGESNAIDAATRQVLDDLAYARLRAINDRTTVYMLFVPPDVETQADTLAPYRLTGYTLFTRRAVGEQPGRQNPRQLISWRHLPDKTFFPKVKFSEVPTGVTPDVYELPFAWTNNFPLVITNSPPRLMAMSYLAFNPHGQVVRFDSKGRAVQGQNEIIALARGSVVHPQNAAGVYTEEPDAIEVPKGNRRYIQVNWLTGRAQVLGDLISGSGSTAQIRGRPE